MVSGYGFAYEADYETARRGMATLISNITDGKQQLLHDQAARVVVEAKPLAPFRTGALRSSIQILSEDRDSVVFGSLLRYAGFVEFGTQNSPMQQYFRPAIEKAMEPTVILKSMALISTVRVTG